MSKRPHLIFLMTDQQRWDALGCENPVVQTPHLDKLAASGIRFNQAVCQAPMCVPSRYSMMQGLYPSQTGVRTNGQGTCHDSELVNTPLPEQLRQRGYQTWGFGKTHWYSGFFSNTPQHRGFERIWQARTQDSNQYTQDAVVWSDDEPEAHAAWQEEQKILPKGGESFEGYLGLTSQIPGSHHREGWLTRKCVEEIQQFDAESDHPLFLYFSLDFPHAGLYVPAEFEELYDLDDIPERPLADWHLQEESHRPRGHIEHFHGKWAELSAEERRRSTLRYYAAMSYADDCFGQVLNALEAKGMLEDSLIIMTSDHGEMLGDRDHRYSKYCLYEGSVRVPMLLSGVGVPEEKRGSVDERHVELVDVLPTLCEAGGCPRQPELAGRSLLEAPCRQGSFAEMHGAGTRFEPSQRAPMLMWRTTEWKLILHLPGSIGDGLTRLDEMQGELYHLAEDPVELVNRFEDESCQEIRERLTRELLMHKAIVQARWPRQSSILELDVNEPEEVGVVGKTFGKPYWY